ncbi:MAD2 mitotic arrest deficient-like 2 [Rhizopus azygosporus]|uniref:MAD2 mitotic arrest deficient-like 2 n=2 Tax=Rhizopus TaxID=4842 RepID=A0A367JIZ4_RHIAZ|nr:DNA-binding protein [Rhizopus microsporus]RCH89856.1 MAD2 mitotic arrest deficient-like 2 [Rhizopus azygosporus]
MKSYVYIVCLLTLAWSAVCNPLSALKYSSAESATSLLSLQAVDEDMNNMQIVKTFLAENAQNDAVDIIYPTNNEVWHVNQQVSVIFREANYEPDETVSIYFFNLTPVLAGGPLNQRVFTFTVPASAYTGPDNTATLVAVKLEVWFHQILYYRNLYPRKVFEQRKKFQAPVYIAIHPEIQKYISQFVQSCYPLLEKGDIRCINLTVKNEKDDSIIEKVVFEINSVLKHVDIPLSKMYESESTCTLDDIEHHLRACLLKLNAIPSLLNNPAFSENRTFSLSIETTEGGYPVLSHDKQQDVDWVPAEVDTTSKRIIPIKSASMDIFRFNTFIMESSIKGKERCS